MGYGLAIAFPVLGVDPRMAALVGMAAMFAGASRAFLTSVVFAYETTHQPHGLLALLAGCSAAYAVSFLLLKESIMTEKIARRGVRVIGEYAADFLDQVLVKEVAVRPVVSLAASRPVAEVRSWIAANLDGASHQGWPVVDGSGQLLGVVTRRDLAGGEAGLVGERVKRPPAVIFEDSSLREAADLMVRQEVGRLPVVSRADPRRAIGFLTRSDLLTAHQRRLAEYETEVSLDWRERLSRRRKAGS